MMPTAQTLKDLSFKAVMAPAMLWLAGFGVAGVWSLVSQIWDWLRFGYWYGLNSLTIVALLGGQDGERWALSPQEWIGVHQFLGWLPQCFGFWLVAVTPICVVLSLTKS